MSHIVTRTFQLLLFVGAGVFYAGSSAGIYKGTDAKGNVYFSDQPIDNSVEYKPNSISVIGPTKVKESEEAKETGSDDFKYTRFDIVSPLQNQVIRNEPNISISLQIAPPLNVAQNHTVWLLMDGKPVVKDSQKMSLDIGRVDRGAHTFQAQVKDESGKIVARTRSVVAHVKYGSK